MRLGPAFCLLAVSWIAACSPPPAKQEMALDTEEQKTLYALGAVSARNLRQFSLAPDEVELILAGLRDVLLGQEPRIVPDEYIPKLQAFVRDRTQRAQAAEREESQKFLDEAAKLPGAVAKPSGLVYVEKKKGDGAAPSASNTVKVHYRGTLRDGTEFDSSHKRNAPAVFPLNGVIPCWTEALQLMQVGGTAEIYCPAAIAYGDSGQGELIRPGAALRFEVELLSIE
jgi:FKBP-type peptidyl-prolyl cis-trans isomerase FkpA